MIDEMAPDAAELAGYAALGELIEARLDLPSGMSAVWTRQHSRTGLADRRPPLPAGPEPTVDDPHGADGSTVARLVLGTQLRRLREAAGFSRLRAATAIDASLAKISRLELGRGPVKRHDLEALLTLYGVTDPPERAAHLQLASADGAADRHWQHDSVLLPRGFEMYLRLEQVASHVRAYQLQVVPDLLQCPDYARQLGRSDPAIALDGDLDRHVQQLANRQRLLTEPGGPQYWAVVDEGALRRSLGSPAVLRAQLRHILELSELRNVTVQMLPFTAGGQFVAAGPFTVLRFTEPDLPDVVYHEHLSGAVYVDRRSDVEGYHSLINRASVQALTPADTRTRIQMMIASG
jgi:transcriptional regulator with XRE-family HTH domain